MTVDIKERLIAGLYEGGHVLRKKKSLFSSAP